MSETTNTPPELSAFDAKAAFMNEVSEELLTGFAPEVTEDATEPSQDEPVVEDADVVTEAEVEPTVEEDSEEDILNDLLGEDESEGDSDDAEEEVEDITDNSTFTLKVDGEEVEVTLDELKKSYGRSKALTQKEMEVAEQRKQLDELQNTITHLQYQGEFAPKFHDHNTKVAALNEAKDALASGMPYKGVSGDKLAQQITTAEVILDKESKALQKEYEEKTFSVEAPGRKALEARLPDIADKYNDYAKGWGEVGREFQFTDVELANNSDFRFYNMAQEIIETRSELDAIKAKIEKARAKRRGGNVAKGSAKAKAGSSSPKRTAAKRSQVSTEDLHERIQAGDHSARREVVRDIFGDL